MAGLRWSPDEIAVVATGLPYDKLPAWFQSRRTRNSWKYQRERLGLVGADPPRTVPTFLDGGSGPMIEKRVGDIHWREVAAQSTTMRELRQRSGWSQYEVRVAIPADRPVGVIVLADLHIGSWATDYTLLERITDEILGTPDLYVVLAGDLAHLAIKLRNVAEVMDNLLPPELVHEFLIDWLKELAPRVLFACAGNHEWREEAQAGSSLYHHIMERTVAYSRGIAHADVTVGDETYRWAVAHTWQGRSIYNPMHGAQRYEMTKAPSREIFAAGDSHQPGILCWWHEGIQRTAINAGSIQTDSDYAKRHFELITCPVFPLVELRPDRHAVAPFTSIRDWLATRYAHDA